MFAGSYVALVTPFTDDGAAIDFDKFKELIEWQIDSGTAGIVPAGTTGEAATMTHEEQLKIIQVTVETVAGRCQVIAGTGSNNTAEALRLTQGAKDAGADAALVVSPYYNKPTPAGLLQHYRTLAETCDIPIVLYNVPSRTGSNVLPDTVAMIYKEVEQVVVVKEASGSVDQTSAIRKQCDITVLSGDDALTLPLMSVGAAGVISVVANIMPAEMAALCAAAAANDYNQARAIHYQLWPVMKAMFVETNPIPVKTSLRLMGRINGALRLPLCEIGAAGLEQLSATLREGGVI